MSRLDARTVLPTAVRGPAPRPRQVGIVHLGIGAFHRAHQAVLTEDAAAAAGDDRWGILGVTQRSDRVVRQIRPQDGLYGVLTLGERERSLRVIGSVLDAVHPGPGGDVARVLAAIAAPTTHVVTLTITEKGYLRRPGGGLDVAAFAPDRDAVVRALVVGGDPVDEPPAASAIGLLVRGLWARHQAGGEPLTVVSCDNVAANGRVLEGLVREAVEAIGSAAGPDLRGATDGLARWLDDAVTFPSSVVDRIVPATTDAHRAVARELLGADDDALVVGEPYAQWVIEDRFAGPRPAWEAAGVQLVDDVTPYEDAKLLLLNATHSLLAYAGALAGHETMADAVRDPRLAVHARALQAEARSALDADRSSGGGPDLDLVAYAEQVLERFANPATGHLTRQVASDGTQKIPLRWGPTLTGLAATDATELPADGVLVGLAAWAAFVERALRTGAPLDDPRVDELRALVEASTDTSATVAALLSLPGLLPGRLGTDPRVVDGVTRARKTIDA
ncbi:mannitol dehydrogenase family protein [Luteimicrobium sp. NPDC057192]|uniref:mannitol dehydrogenase family protein n=1 Tax=Luteimicrobium sp. NPDC057192 TaxID=3346042 RepID=UPI00363E17A0